MKIIKWLLLLPVALIVLGVIGTELNKGYWDYQVKKMCHRDGGATVFETVFLTQEQYKKNDGDGGMIRILPKRMTKPYHEFYRKRITTIIKKSNPDVTRSESIIVRKSDEKELGKSVYYSRRGGDFPTGFHPSSFSCLNIANINFNLEKKVFLIAKDIN
tara:strand:+ start:4014 stop:4490 length:477 start_codon:yes stop_codon:yes gene_type:complete